jgi:hypothetical protein
MPGEHTGVPSRLGQGPWRQRTGPSRKSSAIGMQMRGSGQTAEYRQGDQKREK